MNGRKNFFQIENQYPLVKSGFLVESTGFYGMFRSLEIHSEKIIRFLVVCTAIRVIGGILWYFYLGPQRVKYLLG